MNPAASSPVPPPAYSPPTGIHKLLAPLLKYLEARGVLLTLEAKEALRESIGLFIGAAILCVASFAAWLLVVTAVIGLLTQVLDWSWVTGVALTGAVHVLLIGGLGLWMIRKLRRTRWFSHTVQELKHDRQWLRGTTVNA